MGKQKRDCSSQKVSWELETEGDSASKLPTEVTKKLWRYRGKEGKDYKLGVNSTDELLFWNAGEEVTVKAKNMGQVESVTKKSDP